MVITWKQIKCKISRGRITQLKHPTIKPIKITTRRTNSNLPRVDICHILRVCNFVTTRYCIHSKLGHLLDLLETTCSCVLPILIQIEHTFYSLTRKHYHWKDFTKVLNIYIHVCFWHAHCWHHTDKHNIRVRKIVLRLERGYNVRWLYIYHTATSSHHPYVHKRL